MSTGSGESNEETDQNVNFDDLPASVALKRVSEEGGLSPPQRKRLRETDITMHGIDNGDMQHCGTEGAKTSYEEDNSIYAFRENSCENLPKVRDKQGQDIVRLIGHYLKKIGLDRSAELLTQESGCSLDHPAALKFSDHVMQGCWTEVEQDLLDLKALLDESSEKWRDIKFMVLEQKYLEFLDDGRVIEAMNILREELSPLQYNTDRVHLLSTFMFCNSWELRIRAKWDGKGEKTRAQLIEKVRTYIPPKLMLPPDRLQTLLSQAIEHQQNGCLYHNTLRDGLDNVSLLVDHHCTTDQLPCETIQLIHDHSDEVWFCKFSPNGMKLATASKDSTVIIWDVNVETLTCTRSMVLDDHPFGIAYIAWSPNSQSIIACGREGCSEVWIWKLGDDPTVHIFQAPEDSLTACAWYGDGESFIVGGSRGHCYLCDSEGRILDSRGGVRVTSFWCQKDGETMLASDTHHRLRSFHFDDETPDNLILNENFPIMTFSVNANDRLALLNIANQGINMWDLKDRILIRKFQGALQGVFTINSCFGGVNQDFIASGSEDGRVYMWNIKKEFPLASLIGHTATVNCVSWNPRFHQMLASASDDRTVRIWAPLSVQNCLHREPEKSCNSSSLDPTDSQQMFSSVMGDKTIRVPGSTTSQCIVLQGSETSHSRPLCENSSSLHLMDTNEPSTIILENLHVDEKQKISLIKQESPGH